MVSGHNVNKQVIMAKRNNGDKKRKSCCYHFIEVEVYLEDKLKKCYFKHGLPGKIVYTVSYELHFENLGVF